MEKTAKNKNSDIDIDGIIEKLLSVKGLKGK